MLATSAMSCCPTCKWRTCWPARAVNKWGMHTDLECVKRKQSVGLKGSLCSTESPHL